MKISEITVNDVVNFLKLEEYCERDIETVMEAAKAYISSYTGIPAEQTEGKTCLDDYKEFYIVLLVLCQDMYDNRSFTVEKTNVNRVVQSILDLHSRNYL